MERAPYTEPVLELKRVYATAVSLRFLVNRILLWRALVPLEIIIVLHVLQDV